jgi:hypothetical protein
MGARSESLVITERLAGGSRLGTCHTLFRAMADRGRGAFVRRVGHGLAGHSRPPGSHLLLGGIAALRRPCHPRLRRKLRPWIRSGLTRPTSQLLRAATDRRGQGLDRPDLATGTLLKRRRPEAWPAPLLRHQRARVLPGWPKRNLSRIHLENGAGRRRRWNPLAADARTAVEPSTGRAIDGRAGRSERPGPASCGPSYGD